MEWQQEGPWQVVIPLIPIVTVEGRLCWFRRCQQRKLRHRTSREVIYQYRVLPVSDIWRHETVSR